jgi:hypothetical protein
MPPRPGSASDARKVHAMTLCIAARCIDDEIPRPADLPLRYAVDCAITSYDTHKYAGNVKEDNARKIAVLSPHWCALVGGDLPQGHALARAIGREIIKETQPDELTLADRIRAGAKGYLLRKFIAERFGVTYDDIFDPKKRVPKNVRDRILASASVFAETSPYPVQQLVFIGWVRNRFTLHLYHDGQVFADDNYLTIGTGFEHANMMLAMGGQRSFMGLSDAVYRVYEAQRIGTAAHAVGLHAEMSVLRYDVRQDSIASVEIYAREGDFLDKTFHDMMPKRPTKAFQLEPGTVPGAWNAWSFRFGRRGVGFDSRGRETDQPKGASGMQKANGRDTPAEAAAPRDTDDQPARFDRVTSALFQVPKDALREVETRRKKRPRRRG